MRWLWLGVKILVSSVFLYALFSIANLHMLFLELHSLVFWPLIPIFIVLPIAIALRAVRFKWIYGSQGRTMTFMDSFDLALIGETLNVILPGSTGDIAKAYYGYRKHSNKEAMLAAVILDKMVALIAICLIGAIASAGWGFWLLAAGFGGATIILSLCTFIPRILPWKLLEWLQQKRKFIDTTQLFTAFSLKPRIKIYALMLSIVAWIVSFVHLYFIALLFGININPLFLGSVAPLINLSRLFPLSWAGLGVQEGVTTYLFGLVGISAAASILISLAFTITLTFIPGIAGLFILLHWKD